MVRVGVPADVDEKLLGLFPAGSEVVRVDSDGSGELPLDVWIPPLYPKQVEAVAKRVRGVKLVQSLWAGVDVLLPYVPQGATLCDGRGVHDISVAEYVVAVVLGMLKYLPYYVRMQEKGQWKLRFGAEKLYLEAHPGEGPQVPPVLLEELTGKTVLIVGYGAIGESVEARLAPFGVQFLRVARHRREGVEPIEELDALLPKADVVILLVPLTEATRGLFDRGRLAKMKHAALLVNVARGPVVDTDALVEALEAGRIRAVVDVTDPEPLPDGHPLWSAPNVLITPHIGGSSPHFMERAIRLAASQVRRFMAGDPLQNVVHEGY